MNTGFRRIRHRVIEEAQQIFDFMRQQAQRRAFHQAAQRVTPPPPANLDLRPDSIVLVLSAHADDEALGCLGLLNAHHDRGCVIEWLVLTDGRNATGMDHSPEETAVQRRNEAHAVQTAYGWQLCHWWGIPCPVSYSAELRIRLVEFLAEIRPALIYAPFAYNHHPEHRLAATLVAEATPESIPIRWYAVQTPLTPVFTTAVYADAELTRHTEDALRLYKSQQHMRRSFRAALYLQQLEGMLYGQMTPVTSICEFPADRRFALIRALTAAAEAETPCKPNQPAHLWRDYLHLWSQATQVSKTIGFQTSRGSVIS